MEIKRGEDRLFKIQTTREAPLHQKAASDIKSMAKIFE